MNAEIRRRLWLASTALLAAGAGTGIYLRVDGGSPPQEVAPIPLDRNGRVEIEQPQGGRRPQPKAEVKTAEDEPRPLRAIRDKGKTLRRPTNTWKQPVTKRKLRRAA